MKIRVVTENDAPELLDIYTPYVENTAITFEYEVPSVEEFRKRIESVLKKYPYICAEKDGEIVGYAYAHEYGERAAYAWTVKTSVYVKENCRRQGIGKTLYNSLEDILKNMGILKVCACITCPRSEDDPYATRNSMEFHTHMGYRKIGHFECIGYKFDRWYDTVYMEKDLGEHISGIGNPIAFNKIKNEM